MDFLHEKSERVSMAIIKYIKKKLGSEKKFLPERIEVDPSNTFNSEELKVINLLNYTKKSGATYSGELYNSGYHTLQLGDKTLVGQRNPSERFKNIPYDFTGKTVLDIGSNQGGMLHACADKIKQGIGIDYDSKMVNVANKIKSFSKNQHLQFYVFDLEKENLSYIKDLLPGNGVDISFLLSVCMWLKNWKEVIDFVKSISTHLLFESNGSVAQQEEQIDYLKSNYKEVHLINEVSDDDPLQKNRKLLLCSN